MRRLCKNREYHEKIDEDSYCYRYPPKLVSIKGQLQTEYPLVDAKVDWCGEFKAVDAVIEAEAVEE